jgi:hypothetical protein
MIIKMAANKVKLAAQPLVSLPLVICGSLLTCCSTLAAVEVQAASSVTTTLPPKPGPGPHLFGMRLHRRWPGCGRRQADEDVPDNRIANAGADASLRRAGGPAPARDASPGAGRRDLDGIVLSLINAAINLDHQLDHGAGKITWNR